MTAKVAIVLVSHSAEVARGVVELAIQMAPNVLMRGVGGGPDGGLGTSLDAIQASFEEVLEALAGNASAAGEPVGLPEGAGVVVLGDLGSSLLTVESALELDDSLAERGVILVRAPFLEGAVAAAVRANGGFDRDAVIAAAVASVRTFAVVEEASTEQADVEQAGALGSVRGMKEVRTVTVRNPLGLHARPAALVSRTVADLGVAITINGVDATSVLQLMSLGATQGHELRVVATGDGAVEAVATVVAMIESGFEEV